MLGTREEAACDGGVRTRDCLDGRWAAFGACLAPAVCVDGATEGHPCGLNNRGQQVRACADGRWGAFGACADGDVCVDGTEDTAACPGGGTHTRRCQRGAWSAFNACPGGPVDACVAPLGPVVLVDGRTNLQVDTTDHLALQTASCGAGADGPEAAVTLRANAAVHVVLTATASPFDTVFHLRTDCDAAASEIACNDDTDGTNSRLEVDLAAGHYTLLVDAFGVRESGVVELEIEVGSRACDAGAEVSEPCDGGRRSRACIGGLWSAWSECAGPRCDPRNDPDCAQCTDAAEDNDTLADRQPIALNEPVEDLTLCGAMDSLDYYAVRANAAMRVLATVDVDPAVVVEGDWTVDIIDQAGGHSVGHTVGGHNLSMEHALITPGDYAVVVDGTELTALMPYTLQIDVEAYRACEFTGNAPGCFHCADAMEPNNTIPAARPINVGQRVANLSVCPELDTLDYYAFTIAQRRRVRAEVSWQQRVGSTGLGVLTQEGNLALFSGESGGGSEAMYGDLDAGTYIVHVYGWTGASGYDLIVTAQ